MTTEEIMATEPTTTRRTTTIDKKKSETTDYALDLLIADVLPGILELTCGRMGATFEM